VVAVIGSQCAADIEFEDAVGATQQPVAAGDQYLAAQLWTFKLPTLEGNDQALAALAGADVEWRPHLEGHAIEQFAAECSHETCRQGRCAPTWQT
jgi:hypothetical protein